MPRDVAIIGMTVDKRITAKICDHTSFHFQFFGGLFVFFALDLNGSRLMVTIATSCQNLKI